MDYLFVLKYLGAGIVTVLGAIAHATIQWKRVREGKDLDVYASFTAVDFLILFMIASFSGLLTGILTSLITDNVAMIAFGAGVGAVSGLEGLTKVKIVFFERLLKNIGNGDK